MQLRLLILEINVSSKTEDILVKELKNVLTGYSESYKITIKDEKDDLVTRSKKRYFSMVDELGRFCGYLSAKDRKLFKEQIKKELGDESIAEMNEYHQIYAKIEELAEFASKTHEYVFK